MTKMIAVEISVGRLGVAVTCARGLRAFSYVLSNVLQQHEAEQTPEDETLKLGLLGAARAPAALARRHGRRCRRLRVRGARAGQRHTRARRTDPRHLVAPLAVPRRDRSTAGTSSAPDWVAAVVLGRRRLALPRARGADVRHRARRRPRRGSSPRAADRARSCWCASCRRAAASGCEPRGVPRPGRGHALRRQRGAHEGLRPLSRWRRLQLGAALGAGTGAARCARSPGSRAGAEARSRRARWRRRWARSR